MAGMATTVDPMRMRVIATFSVVYFMIAGVTASYVLCVFAANKSRFASMKRPLLGPFFFINHGVVSKIKTRQEIAAANRESWK
jgi:hypothetical protein